MPLSESLFPLLSPDHENILTWVNNEWANHLLPVVYRDRQTSGIQAEILTKALVLAGSIKVAQLYATQQCCQTFSYKCSYTGKRQTGEKKHFAWIKSKIYCQVE